jgi:hypothetical protein
MKTTDTKKTKEKEMDIVHIDGNPVNNSIKNLQPENHAPKIHEWMDEYLSAIDFALREWGIRNELRLFGIEINEYYDPHKKVLIPHGKGLFTGFGSKDFYLMHFNIIKSGERIIVTRTDGFKYPIRILRTNGLITRNLAPVLPFYNVLIGAGVILPFQSHVKGKKRKELPFEDMGDMETIKMKTALGLQYGTASVTVKVHCGRPVDVTHTESIKGM